MTAGRFTHLVIQLFRVQPGLIAETYNTKMCRHRDVNEPDSTVKNVPVKKCLLLNHVAHQILVCVQHRNDIKYTATNKFKAV